MRKFFEIIGVLTLVIVSFSYQSEVSKVVKMTDTLMEEIEARAPSYKQNKLEAVIIDNTIVPGVNGRKVDVNNSYRNMKKDGFFDENKIIYKKDYILYPLEKNTDKYIISGNHSKKNIALVFSVDKNDDTNKISTILKENEAKATFFIKEDFARKNNLLRNLITDGHTIGNLEEANEYIWLKTLINSSGQKHNYCIAVKENESRLSFCHKYNDYTVKVPVLIKENLFSYIKNNNKNGQIFYIDINSKTSSELYTSVNYLKARGYTLKSLEEFLEE